MNRHKWTSLSHVHVLDSVIVQNDLRAKARVCDPPATVTAKGGDRSTGATEYVGVCVQCG